MYDRVDDGARMQLGVEMLVSHLIVSTNVL